MTKDVPDLDVEDEPSQLLPLPAPIATVVTKKLQPSPAKMPSSRASYSTFSFGLRGCDWSSRVPINGASRVTP